MSLRQFLGFEREYAHLGSLNPSRHSQSGIRSTLSSKSKLSLALLLHFYRVLDIGAALHSHPVLPIQYKKNTTAMTEFKVRSSIFFLPFKTLNNIFSDISRFSMTGEVFFRPLPVLSVQRVVHLLTPNLAQMKLGVTTASPC